MKLPSFIIKAFEKYCTDISTALLFFIPAICFYAFQGSVFYFQENNSLFICSGEFIRKFIYKPGGLLQYSGLFLTQGYYSPLYGSLAISAISILLGKVFSAIGKQLSGGISFPSLLAIVPSCLLILLQKRFDHLMEFNLGFLVTAAGFLFLLKIHSRHKAVIPFLVPFFSYFAGSFALILFSMYVVYVIAIEKRPLKILVPVSVLISALITFVLFSELIFLQPAKLIILNPLQKYNSGLPVLLVILAGYFILFPFIIKSVHVLSDKFHVITGQAIMILIFFATVFLLTESSDPAMAENAVLEKMVDEQNWKGVISHHEESPSADITGQYLYNIALSETDQLCDRLFKGQQDFGAGSLKLPEDGKPIEIYYYYTTGLINEAHHLAIESFIKYGCQPVNVRFIIKTEIIRGNYKVAEKFIDILKHTMHYRGWALRYQKFISDTALIRSDPELSRRIALLPKDDFFIKPVDSLNLKAVLKNNPFNHVAFEYKMARLLFEKDLKTIKSEAEKMEEIGYNYMPAGIGEAIVYGRFMNHEEIPAEGNSLKDIESRFRQYLNDYNKNKGGLCTEEKMKAAWGNTFWYYYDFK